MSASFYDAVVSVDINLPLSSRSLAPEGLDSTSMFDHQGLPMNTSVAALKNLDEVLFALHQKTSKRCNRSHTSVTQSCTDDVPTLANTALEQTKKPMMSMSGCFQGIPLDSDGHPAFEWEVSPFTSPLPSLTDKQPAAEEHNTPPAKQDAAPTVPPRYVPQALATLESYCPQYSSELDPDSLSSSISSALLYIQDIPPTSSFLTFEDDSPPTTPAHIDTTIEPSYFATDAHQYSSLPAIEELPALEAALRPSGPGFLQPEPAHPSHQSQHYPPSRIPRATSAPKAVSRIPSSPRKAQSTPLGLASTCATLPAASAHATSSTSLDHTPRLLLQLPNTLAQSGATVQAVTASPSEVNSNHDALLAAAAVACTASSPITEVVATNSYALGKTRRLFELRQKAVSLAAVVAGSLRRLKRSGPLKAGAAFN